MPLESASVSRPLCASTKTGEGSMPAVSEDTHKVGEASY